MNSSLAIKLVERDGHGARALTLGHDASHVPSHGMPELARTLVLAQQAGVGP